MNVNNKYNAVEMFIFLGSQNIDYIYAYHIHKIIIS